MRLFPTFLAAFALAFAFAAGSSAHAEEGLRDFCAERPGSATPPCILDAGHVMVEVDGADVTRARQDGGGWAQTTIAFAPHLRWGLTDKIEAGVSLQPYVTSRASGGDSASGFGDAVANLKISLRNPDGGGTSVALLPYASIPTAQKGLGAGGVQGGLIVPISVALPKGFTLGFDPEVDVLRNEHSGVHAAYLNVVSLARAVVPGLNGAVELVASHGEGHDRHVNQVLAGANLAWFPPRTASLQFDAGVNVGLNRQAPALRVYIGVSKRF